MEYQLDRISRPVVIVPHEDRWQGELHEPASSEERIERLDILPGEVPLIPGP